MGARRPAALPERGRRARDRASPPRELLDRLLEVERELGRTRDGPRWGPRTIDLDLLLYGDETIDEPGLTVPASAAPRAAVRARAARRARPRSGRPGPRRGGGPAREATIAAVSHLDELDDFEAELELRLKREYSAVYSLFRYCVLTQDATYLCNKLDLQYVPQPAYPFFQVKMEDVWVWDKNRPTRMIPRVEVYTSADVTVEELRARATEPTLTAEALAKRMSDRAHRRRRLALRCAARAADAARDRRRQHADRLRPLRRRAADRAVPRRHRPARTRPTSSAVLLRAFVDLEALDGIVLSLDRAAARARVRGASPSAGRASSCSCSGPACRPGVPIRYDDPREVGPDRIANAVAARERHGAPCDRRRLRHLDELRRRLGGGRVRRRRARAGDRGLDGRALRARGAADEGAVRRRRERVIGKTTTPALQSGLVYGFAGQVDAIVDRIRDELGAPDAPVDRHGRPAEPDRAALADDHRRRPGA